MKVIQFSIHLHLFQAIRRAQTTSARPLFASASLYLCALCLYSILPYYVGFIDRTPVNLRSIPEPYQAVLHWIFNIVGSSTHSVLWHLFFFSILYQAIMYWRRIRPSTRALQFFQATGKVVAHFRPLLSGSIRKPLPPLTLSSEEKLALRLALLKFIFLPIMLNFVFQNIEAFTSSPWLLGSLGTFQWEAKARIIFFTVFNAILLIDTSFFAIGYLFEFHSSRIRSVEPTFFGWAIALMCYPPFNGITTQYVGWASSDFTLFRGHIMTVLLLSCSLFGMLVYGWATLALGLKASNLTNRGIVARGPYRYVRHPAYIGKNLHWLIMGIPSLQFGIAQVTLPLGVSLAYFSVNWTHLLSLAAWACIYYFRAVTEENHLIQDPDYQKYCRTVRYRFIPGLL